MKWHMRRLIGTTALALLGSAPCTLAGGGEEDADGYIMVAFGSLTESPLVNFECRYFGSGCPGAIDTDNTGCPRGCGTAPECDGTCYFCPSSTTPIRACLYTPTKSCTNTSTYASCGQHMYAPCLYTPIGGPPCQCSCDTANGATTFNPCPLLSCQ